MMGKFADEVDLITDAAGAEYVAALEGDHAGSEAGH